MQKISCRKQHQTQHRINTHFVSHPIATIETQPTALFVRLSFVVRPCLRTPHTPAQAEPSHTKTHTAIRLASQLSLKQMYTCLLLFVRSRMPNRRGGGRGCVVVVVVVCRQREGYMSFASCMYSCQHLVPKLNCLLLRRSKQSTNKMAALMLQMSGIWKSTAVRRMW